MNSSSADVQCMKVSVDQYLIKNRSYKNIDISRFVVQLQNDDVGFVYS